MELVQLWMGPQRLLEQQQHAQLQLLQVVQRVQWTAVLPSHRLVGVLGGSHFGIPSRRTWAPRS